MARELAILCCAAGSGDSAVPCPETAASFPSVITFSWFDSLAWTGYKRALLAGDLWDLNPRDKSSTCAPKFEANWGPKLRAANLASREREAANFSAGSEKVVVETAKKKTSRESLSIFLPLIKSFGLSFLVGSVLKFVHDIAVFIAPLLLKYGYLT